MYKLEIMHIGYDKETIYNNVDGIVVEWGKLYLLDVEDGKEIEVDMSTIKWFKLIKETDSIYNSNALKEHLSKVISG